MMKAVIPGCGDGTGGVFPGAAAENVLLQEAQGLNPWLQEVFFRLHRNPELGTKEFKTQALILEELEKMGVEAAPIADTGVVGLIRGGKPGKTVAFRADMDALPITEQTNLPYSSQNPGVMHACGHDAHVTVLLGAAKMLCARAATMRGNVKLLFQPAEEGIGGAERMIADGCMENPHVDAVFFSHCTAEYPAGAIMLRSGPATASSNPFTVTFRGKGTHGAKPQNGTDSIVAACQTVLALQTISSRRTSPTDSVVVTVGSIHGGTTGNVIPETVTLSGTIRTLTPETRARVKADFRQIVSGTAAAMGVEAEIDMVDGYAATINDEAMTQLVRSAAQTLLGKEHVFPMKTPTMGSEDFGYYCQKAPGCYYGLGIANAEKGFTYPIHNPHFTVDPEALPYGAALYTQIAEDFLAEE